MTYVPPTVNNGYIGLPITINPNLLVQAAFANIQAQIPGWVPHEGQLDVAIIEEACQLFASCAVIANQVPITIFESYGELVGVVPIVGAGATAPALFTMTDSLGYTIPAGTVVAYQQSGSNQILFTTQTTLVIPASSTTGTVEIACETVGTFANDLPNATLQLVTTFAQVASIATTDTTSGGVDPETSTGYINRLSNELQLLTPRPILPADFAALAQNVTGVFRALAINLFSPGRMLIDVTLFSDTILTDPTGSFATVDVGRTVSGADIPFGTVINAFTDANNVVMNHSATASGAGNTVVLGDLTGVERCVTVAGVQADGTPLTTDEDTALLAYLETLREVNFVTAVIDPTYAQVDISVTCFAVAGANTSAVEAAVEASLTSFLSPAIWGGGADQVPTWSPNTSTVSFLEVANVILETAGVLFINSGDLHIALSGNALGSVDITLPGAAPLPEVGTISVTALASS